MYYVDIDFYIELKSMAIVKIQENSNRLSVTMPKSITDLKGWKKGTMLEVQRAQRFSMPDRSQVIEGYKNLITVLISFQNLFIQDVSIFL